MTAAPHVQGYVVRALADADKAPLQAFFDEDPDYFQGVNGRDIPVEEICTMLPPGLTRDDKFLFVIERDGRIAGMVDLIRGYPERPTWFLGFIFVVKWARGLGLARAMLHALYAWVASKGGKTLRLGVVEGNARARWLYATEGFVFVAMREVDPSVNRMRRTLVLERPL